MVNSNSVFNDARTNLRVKDNRRIAWYLNGGEVKGQAKIRNISASGMLIETRSSFKPDQSCTFSFDAALGLNNYVPQHGRLVWYRKKSFASNKYQYGIKFLEPTEFVLAKLRQRIQKGILRLTALRRMRSVLNVGLVGLVVALFGFIVWQSGVIYKDISETNYKMLGISGQQALLTQSYVHRLDATQLQLQSVTDELAATKKLYHESELLLAGVSQDLAVTKTILAETEELLAQSEAKLAALSQGNANLEGQVAELQKLNAEEIRATKEELTNTIALLQEKNLQLNRELQVLQDQMSFNAGEIKSEQEGRELLKVYKTRMKQVKAKIKYYRTEAEGVRTAALKERDRIKMILGNNGFLMKNGEVVSVDYDKYEEAEGPSKIAGTQPSPNKVKVNVDFFE